MASDDDLDPVRVRVWALSAGLRVAPRGRISNAVKDRYREAHFSQESCPPGLLDRGRKLWRDLHEGYGYNPAQEVLAEEACRLADRLERLDRLLRGDMDTWVHLTHRLQAEDYVLTIDAAASEARQTALALRTLLADLKLEPGSAKKEASTLDVLTARRQAREAARDAARVADS